MSTSSISWPLHAMSNAFVHAQGYYALSSRLEMLAELGYAGMLESLQPGTGVEEVCGWAGLKEKHGVGIEGIYATLDVGLGPGHNQNVRVVEVLRRMSGIGRLEVSIRKSGSASDAEANEAARELLETMLPIAREVAVTICLYPHWNFWMERHEEAAELCEAVGQSHLKMTFGGYHWFAADGNELGARVVRCGPMLASANVCGAFRAQGSNGLPAVICPLGEGEMDNFHLLGLLRAAKFSGPMVVQGYGIGGDVFDKLRRSKAVYDDMVRRLAEHPEWAELDTAVAIKPWARGT